MTIEEIVANNKASQDPNELKALLEFLPQKPRKVVLEIGVHLGYSLLNWRRAFNPGLLIGIETEKTVIPEVRAAAHAKMIYGDSQSVVAYDQAINLLGKRNIDFLFIDGDHTYKAVRADFELYSGLMAPGGTIVLHDAALVGHPNVEVYQFWQEIRGNYNNHTIHKGGTGYGIIFNF